MSRGRSWPEQEWGIKPEHRLHRAKRRSLRLEGGVHGLPETPFELCQGIQRYLLRCADENHLVNKHHEVQSLVQIVGEKNDEHCEVYVCEKPNNKRDRAQPHLTRTGDAWFDFRFTAKRAASGISLVEYGAELRFPSPLSYSDHPRANSEGPQWVRFDLNHEDHDNDARELRSHFHASTDDWMVPYPMLSPIELLDIIVFDCRRVPCAKESTEK